MMQEKFLLPISGVYLIFIKMNSVEQPAKPQELPAKARRAVTTIRIVMVLMIITSFVAAWYSGAFSF
jgi:hypothetical protein